MWGRKGKVPSDAPSSDKATGAARAREVTNSLDVSQLQAEFLDFDIEGDDGCVGDVPARRLSAAGPMAHGIASGGTEPKRRLSARARYESSVRQAVGATWRADQGSVPGRDINHKRSHHGWLEKEGSLRKNWKRRFFTFDPRSCTVAYFETEACVNKKGHFRLATPAVPRNGIYGRTVTYIGGHSKSFTVHCEGRELHCRAETPDEAVTWCAVLDNEFFYEKLRSEVDARIEKLREGQTFLKHGRMGKPHNRFVWLSKDESRICWAKPESVSGVKSRKLVKKDQAVYLENVQSIERGRKTSVFKRSVKNGSDGSIVGSTSADDLCFSLVANDRTLDLVASDKQTAEFWIGALSYLWLFAHASRERATHTGRWKSWDSRASGAAALDLPIDGATLKAEIGIQRSGHGGGGDVSLLGTVDPREKLENRGIMINELNSQSSKLENSAKTFAEMCQQLSSAERLEKSKGWF